MTMLEAQLQALCDLAVAAGREVMAVYESGDITAWTKDDASPLTEADLRADAVIGAGLRQAFPGVFILSEESAPGAAASHETFFLVDPLDGTKEFLKRNGEFTVNIALIHCGEPVAGVVHAPALGELFYAGRGQGAWEVKAGGRIPLRAPAHDPARALRVIGSRTHGAEAMAQWLAQLGRPHEFVAAGSSLKFCRIAQGQADIYPRIGPTSQWDTAAGDAVLREAEGAVVDAAGTPLRYGLDLPILNPHFVALADPTLSYPPLPAIVK